jgi:hypothetical protein
MIIAIQMCSIHLLLKGSGRCKNAFHSFTLHKATRGSGRSTDRRIPLLLVYLGNKLIALWGIKSYKQVSIIEYLSSAICPANLRFTYVQ